MVDNSQKDKAAAIALANHAVKKLAMEFSLTLKTRVSDLEKALHKNELEKVVELSYNLETEASTFGWPRVTRICKWLRKVFLGDYDQKPDAKDVLHVLNSLKLMVSDPENRNEQRDEDLFRELYPIMAKVVSDF
ncbi:MAG: hypothetical protein P8I94_01085 [Emcibacteraceae bacterium]|nr:hypothetical protein [Emcibacteraceae bacterium]